MKVTELDETFSLNVDSGPRSPGLHVSDIIKDICVEIFPKRFSRDDADMPWEKFELGFTWEAILAQTLAARFREGRSDIVVHPGEIYADGIYMTPDAVDFKTYTLEEYKCSWARSTREITDDLFWHWIVQAKAYCYGMQQCGLPFTKSILRVLFINGDYREHRNAVVRVWELEFTQLEIKENWEMLVQHAKSKGWLK